MAIFYPHIKGFDGSQYTWIDFQHGTGENQLPLIKYNTGENGNNKDNAISLGHIVTAAVTNNFSEIQNFNKQIKFTNYDNSGIQVDLGNVTTTREANVLTYLYHGQTQTILSAHAEYHGGTDHQYGLYCFSGLNWYSDSINTGYISRTGIQWLKKYLRVGNLSVLSSYTSDGDIAASNRIYAAQQIVSNNYMQALYFNATSDKRAKTDIQLLSINALDLIKSVQLYSFKYKDSNKPSIGIIAQEVQDINFQGFNLVDNIEARGENGDYMTIKESKLVYILWKAVQELSAEVEELKQQLKKD